MKKFQLKKRKKAPEVPSRITNETVAEHRERILAGGRRFKYPIQYARHRLVINTIIISVVALLVVIGIGWQQLFLAQNTGNFFYRIARVLPIPVASVDGEQVRYSDYLMNYRSSVHYLQQKEQVNLTTQDGKRQADYYKSESMKLAITDAYAAKIARERGISVGNEQVDKFIAEQRQARDDEISEETHNAVVLDYYGWDPDEYRHVMKAKLLRQEVAYAIDERASATRDEVALQLADTANLEEVATSVNGDDSAGVAVASSGWVPKNNQDGGLSAAAAKLKKGAISDVVRSKTGDGYYFVKLVDINETQVNYEYIRVPLTQFAEQLEAVYDQDKVNEYISIPEVTARTD